MIQNEIDEEKKNEKKNDFKPNHVWKTCPEIESHEVAAHSYIWFTQFLHLLLSAIATAAATVVVCLHIFSLFLFTHCTIYWLRLVQPSSQPASQSKVQIHTPFSINPIYERHIHLALYKIRHKTKSVMHVIKMRIKCERNIKFNKKKLFTPFHGNRLLLWLLMLLLL